MRLHEEPLLMNIGISRNFPRNALHTRNSALGAGIMRPKTIIDMLKFNLHRNKRIIEIQGRK